MADPNIIPANSGSTDFSVFSPDGSEIRSAVCVGWKLTAKGPEPVVYPKPPQGWLIAVDAGLGVILPDGSHASRESIQARLTKEAQ